MAVLYDVNDWLQRAYQRNSVKSNNCVNRETSVVTFELLEPFNDFHAFDLFFNQDTIQCTFICLLSSLFILSVQSNPAIPTPALYGTSLLRTVFFVPGESPAFKFSPNSPA